MGYGMLRGNCEVASRAVKEDTVVITVFFSVTALFSVRTKEGPHDALKAFRIKKVRPVKVGGGLVGYCEVGVGYKLPKSS